jgi:MFS family permease
MGQATIWTAVAARLCSGLGQGLIFISVQTILLANSQEHERTRAAGVIVYGFQGGMIAGMAIGSLVVSSIGEFGVLLTSAVAMLLLVGYGLFYLPSVTPAMAKSRAKPSIISSVVEAVNDRPFMVTVTCIGIPAKAVLTGVIVFAVPLLMTAQGFAEAEIGQMLMLYAAAVMVVSQISSTYIDLHKATRTALLIGATLTGLGIVGLAAIDSAGFVGLPFGETLRVVVIIVAMLIIGIGHGFINAPIVAYVSSLAVAHRVGISGLTASYRFLERIGHVAGPLLVGLFFQLYGETGEALFWLGVGLTSLMLLFALVGRSTPTGHAEILQLAAEPRSLVGLYIDDYAAVMALRIDALEQSAPLDAAARLLVGHLQRHGHSLTLAEDRIGVPLAASTQKLAHFVANYLPTHGQSPSHLIVISGPKGSLHDGSWLRGLTIDSASVVYLAKRHWLEQLQGWLAMLALARKVNDAVPKVTLAAALHAVSEAKGVFIWHADGRSGQRRTTNHDQSLKEQTDASLQPA